MISTKIKAVLEASILEVIFIPMQNLIAYFEKLETDHAGNLALLSFHPKELFIVSESGESYIFAQMMTELIKNEVFKRLITVTLANNEIHHYSGYQDIPDYSATGISELSIHYQIF